MKSRQCRFFAIRVKRWSSNEFNTRRRHRRVKHRFTPAVAFGAIAIMSASWVGAQDPISYPDVVVTGQRDSYKPEAIQSKKYTEPLVDVPQSVTIIPKVAIQEQGATTLRDVLRNVPGISIQAGEGGVPAGDNLSVRGFNARTDIFVDGVRDFGGYTRDPFNVEQVEVIKGPASAYGGRGSTGGAINMGSKQPGLDPMYSGSLGIGTDEYKRGTLDLNQPIPGMGGTAVRLNAMWHENNTPDRNAVENERWAIAPTVTVGLGTPTRATLGYFYMEQDNMPDYGIPWVPNTNTALIGYRDQPPPVDYSNFYGLNARDYEEIKTNIANLALEHDFNESINARNYTRLGETTRDSIITAPRFAANNSTAINRQLQSRDQDDTIISNQTDVTSKFNTGSIEHALVTGLELAREGSENFARTGPTAPQADLYSPNPNDPYGGPVSRSGAKTDAVSKSIGVYAFDTMKFNPQWELSAGVRWDEFAVDYESLAVGGVTTKLDRTDTNWSWRGGLVYKPMPISSVYMSYGTSFNPSAEGLTLANTATATNNVNTDPEESESYEIGTKWELFKKRLLTSFAIFRTNKTNARTEDPTNPADVVVLEGEQRVDGFEVGAAGNLTDRWTLSGGYTYLDSEVTESKNPIEVGKELSNTPKNSVSAWTTYDLPFNLEVGAGGQFVDSRWNSTTTPRKAPSYWTADAMLAMHFNKNLTLRLNGYNLFDEEYIDRVGGGHFIPGSGRSAVVSTDLRF